jgi:triosephosphate isomerase
MKRQHIVAGNWKMNMTFDEGRDLAISILQKAGPTDTLAILCPPFIHLNYISSLLDGVENITLGAQNCHFEGKGAFTGEISASMLESVGVKYVILGHSERREYFGEDEALLAKKINAVLTSGLRPIFCCGEKLDVREAGGHEALVEAQVSEALFHLAPEEFKNVIVAYEPVWAIGTGKTATPEQAQQMHAFIRNLLAQQYGQELADQTTILYGGSCNAVNAKELFSQPDVDGGLIGGASLKAADFITIINSF